MVYSDINRTIVQSDLCTGEIMVQAHKCSLYIERFYATITDGNTNGVFGEYGYTLVQQF